MATLTNAQKFAKAHKIARKIRKHNDSYATAFKMALIEVNRPIDSNSNLAKFALVVMAMVIMVTMPATTTTADTMPLVSEVGYCAQVGVQFIQAQFDLICK